MYILSSVDSPLSATCWTGNRIGVVGVNSTGHMLHVSWPPTQAQNGWDLLGKSFHSIAPAIVSQSDNQLDVFGVEKDTGVMLHSAWNGADWSSWETLGTQKYKSSLAATSWSPGRLDVFVVGLAHGEVHRQWVCSENLLTRSSLTSLTDRSRSGKVENGTTTLIRAKLPSQAISPQHPGPPPTASTSSS